MRGSCFMRVLQQTFLPTDAVFEGITDGDRLPVLLVLAIWLMGGPFLLAAMDILITNKVKVSAVWKRIFKVSSFVFYGAVSLSMIFGIYNWEDENSAKRSEVNRTNYENMISNIEAVYDVEEVDSAYGLANPAGEPELTVIQDGVAYRVIYTEDPVTYEPELVMVTVPTAEVTELRKK